jgi:DNA-binding MarR family transcriptional regulator
MPQPPVLTGQDIAEAQGAVTKLLEHSLAKTGTSREEYVVLRVLAARGPYASLEEALDYLAEQPQVGLTPEAATELLTRLEDRGFTSGTAPGSPGPAQATPEGKARLAELGEVVAPGTRALFAGLNSDDLATTHDVLARITTRATELVSQR